MLYRISIEQKSNNMEKLCSLVTGKFKRFTVMYTNEYYQDKRKPLIVFEIDSDCDIGLVRNLAADIREANQQECVMVQAINSVRYMITEGINGE